MRIKVAKWGNSLGVRLPKAAANAIGAKPGSEFDIAVEDGEIRLRPVRRMPRYKLEDLIAEMERLGPESQPELVNWGPDVGAEIIDDAYARGQITLDDIVKRGRRPKRRKSDHAPGRGRHRMG